VLEVGIPEGLRVADPQLDDRELELAWCPEMRLEVDHRRATPPMPSARYCVGLWSKVSSGPDHLADLAVRYGERKLQHFAKWEHVIPFPRRGPSRRLHDRSLADRLQVLRDGPPVLVGYEAQALADQMDDAGLHPGVGEDSLDRFREALELVDAADQHVLNAALLELLQHLQPELGALDGLEPEPKTSRSPSRLTPTAT